MEYGAGGELDVYVVEIETNQRIRLTDNPALDAFPAWEPRGFVPEDRSSRTGRLAGAS